MTRITSVCACRSVRERRPRVRPHVRPATSRLLRHNSQLGRCICLPRQVIDSRRCTNEHVVGPATELRLIGLRIQDGQTAWQLPIGLKVAVENDYVVSVREGTAEVYEISS